MQGSPSTWSRHQGRAPWGLGLDVGSGFEEHFNHLLMAIGSCPTQGRSHSMPLGLEVGSGRHCNARQPFHPEPTSRPRSMGSWPWCRLRSWGAFQPPSYGHCRLPNARQSFHPEPTSRPRSMGSWPWCRLRSWGAFQPPSYGHCRLPNARQSFHPEPTSRPRSMGSWVGQPLLALRRRGGWNAPQGRSRHQGQGRSHSMPLGFEVGSGLDERFNHLLMAFCGCPMQGSHSIFVLGLDVGSGLEEHFNHLVMAIEGCPMQKNCEKDNEQRRKVEWKHNEGLAKGFELVAGCKHFMTVPPPQQQQKTLLLSIILYRLFDRDPYSGLSQSLNIIWVV